MKKTLLPALALFIAQGINAQVHFSDDFNDGNLTGWTLYDNDSDPAQSSGTNYDNWYASDFSTSFPELGAGSAVSRSWAKINNVNTVLNPNNFMISSAINLTSVSSTGLRLLFQAGTMEPTPYHAEHYAVYVTTSNDPAVIVGQTPVLETTLAVGEAMGTEVIDLGAYAGQTVYLTFRHFNTIDMNTLIIDDVAIKTLQNNDANLKSVTLNRYSATSTNNTLSATIKNDGLNAITSVTLNWNDGTVHSQVISTNIAAGATVTVNHPTAVTYSTVLEKNIAVTVDQVNSATDLITSNNSGSTKINTLSSLPTKKVVFEEGTGTWCGWCVRGAVTMDYMHTTYPNFVGIAVHNGDPMTVTEYDNGVNLSGYPGANVDRVVLGESVSQSIFESIYNQRKNLATPAALTATLSGTGSSVSIAASASFKTVFANANLRLAAVIIEDGVKGTTSGYNQANYYAGGSSGAMGGYESLPDPVPAAQMVYNHVGRALLGGYAGQASSIPTSITDGSTANYTFNYTVPSTSVRGNMHAVVMLIDQSTGEILNATSTSLSLANVNNISKEDIGMNVYPNPATDLVNVDFNASNKNYTVSIIDVTGKVISTTDYSNLNGAQSIQVPVAGLTAGSYIVAVATEGVSFNQHVVIK